MENIVRMMALDACALVAIPGWAQTYPAKPFRIVIGLRRGGDRAEDRVVHCHRDIVSHASLPGVNGEALYRDGRHTGAYPGRVLRSA